MAAGGKAWHGCELLSGRGGGKIQSRSLLCNSYLQVLLLPAARSRRRDWHAAEQDRLPARHNGESLEERAQAFVNMKSNVRFICASFCFAMP